MDFVLKGEGKVLVVIHVSLKTKPVAWRHTYSASINSQAIAALRRGKSLKIGMEGKANPLMRGAQLVPE